MSDVKIRPLRVEDAAALHRIMMHDGVYPNLMQLPTMERASVEEWVEKQQNGRFRLVAAIDDRVIGFGDLKQSQNLRMLHSGQIGLYVHPDFHNQGVGRQLIERLLNLADNWLNLRRVELDVYTHNKAAIALYEKMGFEIEGERVRSTFGNGRFYNDYVMARIRPFDRGPGTPPPQRPTGKRPFPQSIIVRTFQPEDIPAMQTILSQAAICRTTLQIPDRELAFYENRFRPMRDGLHRIVAVADDVVVGSCSIFHDQNVRQQHSGGLGMMVHEAYWGFGIGSRLMEAILDVCDNWLNLHRVELEVNTDNPTAIRLYEKFGFVIEGTKRFHVYGDGRWADSHFMARLKTAV